jgi:hypothetical protein
MPNTDETPTTYPIWSARHEDYIMSCRAIGYSEDMLSRFRDELQRLDIDRVDDFHSYLINQGA